jgi:hypothetical protein
LDVSSATRGPRPPASGIAAALDVAGLIGVADRKVKGYSQGMRQRLGLAAAVMRRPALLLLDEPANGMDPAGIKEFRTLLRRLAGDGTTVFLSSHLLAEVAQVCDQVAVIHAGRLVEQERDHAVDRDGDRGCGSGFRDLRRGTGRRPAIKPSCARTKSIFRWSRKRGCASWWPVRSSAGRTQLGAPCAYGLSAAYIVSCVGVGTPSLRPSATTLPPSHGNSSLLPRKRSTAMEGNNSGGALRVRASVAASISAGRPTPRARRRSSLDLFTSRFTDKVPPSSPVPIAR